jgi:hypothetical protein
MAFLLTTIETVTEFFGLTTANNVKHSTTSPPTRHKKQTKQNKNGLVTKFSWFFTLKKLGSSIIAKKQRFPF